MPERDHAAALDLRDALTSLAAPCRCCRALQLRRHLSPIPLADAGALQYRRRRLRPLGGARARPPRHPARACPTAREDAISYGCAARDLEPARQCAARARHQARRPRRHPAAADAGSRRRAYRDLQARRGRAAARDAVRRRCAALPAAEFRRQGAASPTRKASPSSPRSATSCRSSRCVLSIDGAADGALGFAETARARLVRFHAGRHLAPTIRRMMIYTSGTTGQPKGALHAPSRAARPSARRRDAARFVPASRRPLSGRRPTGPGPAACSTCCCRACITACRWWRASSTSSIRRRPSR